MDSQNPQQVSSERINSAGLLFSIPYISYTIAFIMAPFVIGKVAPRCVIFIGLLVTCFFVLLLYGPSHILQMPR